MENAGGYSNDVAISFPGDDFNLAEELAKLLRDRMTVFLFTERQDQLPAFFFV